LFRKPAASSFSATVTQLVGKLPSIARKPRQMVRHALNVQRTAA
jgi:hypothetical protein